MYINPRLYSVVVRKSRTMETDPMKWGRYGDQQATPRERTGSWASHWGGESNGGLHRERVCKYDYLMNF